MLRVTQWITIRCSQKMLSAEYHCRLSWSLERLSWKWTGANLRLKPTENHLRNRLPSPRLKSLRFVWMESWSWFSMRFFGETLTESQCWVVIPLAFVWLATAGWPHVGYGFWTTNSQDPCQGVGYRIVFIAGKALLIYSNWSSWPSWPIDTNCDSMNGPASTEAPHALLHGNVAKGGAPRFFFTWHLAETPRQACDLSLCPPIHFWETKPQMVPIDILSTKIIQNIGFQSLALIQGQIISNPAIICICSLTALKVRKLANEILSRHGFLMCFACFSTILCQLTRPSQSPWEVFYDRPYKVMIGNREELKGNQDSNSNDLTVVNWAGQLVFVVLEVQDITQIVKVMDAFNKSREIVSTLREAWWNFQASHQTSWQPRGWAYLAIS